MPENTLTKYQNPDHSIINDVIAKYEQLNAQERAIITRQLIKQLGVAKMEEILLIINPLKDCNIIMALHQRGHVQIVKGILDLLEAKSLFSLENTSSSIFSIVRIYLCWKSLIERIMAFDSIWREIVSRRGWMKFFLVSDLRHVNNPDFYRNMYFLIKREIYEIKKKWHSGSYFVKRIQFENTNGVYCLQYDENKIVTGHRDNTVKFWNVASDCVERILVGHSGSVLCLQYDGCKVITGSSDSTIRVWDVVTGNEVQRLEAHTHSVLYLKFDEAILVTSSTDTRAIVWSCSPGQELVEICTLSGHKAAVNVLDFDDSYIVTASGDRTIIVWSRETFTIRNILVGHTRGISCLHQRGNIVASGSSDKTIRLWDILDGVCLRVLTGHSDLVRCIRFNEDYIVSGSYDAEVKIWDYRSIMDPRWRDREHCLSTTHEHSGGVLKIMFDELRIMSCSLDDTVVVMNFFDDTITRHVGTPFE